MMIKKIFTIIIIISLSLGLNTLAKPEYAIDLESPDEFTLIGKVIYIPLEGGFYGIEERATGNKYLPLNLPEAFQQTGIEVQIQAKKVKDISGIAMWGKYIHIQTLELIPPRSTQTQ
ncbi:MAG: hypothetical protein HC877_10380 [Thioploca sp.]|nr:hypothetical protein [Thioploca sp.]